MGSKKGVSFKRWQIIAIAMTIYDYVVILGSFFSALWFRFDCQFSHIEKIYLNKYYQLILPYACFVLIMYYLLGLYRSIWRFASFYELKKLVIATAITLVANAVVVTAFIFRMPISYYVFELCDLSGNSLAKESITTIKELLNCSEMEFTTNSVKILKDITELSDI